MKLDKLKLSQYLIWNLYNKKAISTYILEDLKVNHEDKIIKALKLFVAYLNAPIKTYVNKQGITKTLSQSKRIRYMYTKIDSDNDYFEGSELVLIILGKVLLFKDEVPIQSVIGTIVDLFPFEEMLDNVKVAADMLRVLAEADFYDFYKNNRGEIQIKSLIQLTETTIIKIIRSGYLPPMLVKPEDVTSNFKSPVGGSNILKKWNQHNKDIKLEHIDRANNIPLCIDKHLLNIEEKWNADKYNNELLLGIKLESEVEEIRQRFLLRKKGQFEIIDLILDFENNFYLAVKNDARNRTYVQGYELNYQGTQWQKCLIDINNPKIINID